MRGGLLSSPPCDRRLAPLPVTRAAVLARVLLALVQLAALAGCGQGRLPEGPLGRFPENHDTVGQPLREGGADTIGFDALFNGGPAPAVIDRLVVVSPRHIKLIGAYVTIGGIVGNWPTFPPSFPRSASGRRENRYAISRWANRHKTAAGLFLHTDGLESLWALKRQTRMAASRGSTCFTTSAALITNGTGTCGLS